MNRKELREKVGDLRSRQVDNDDAYETRFNRSCVDVALKRLSGEVPEALVADVETVTVLADKTDSSMGRTLAATTDPYVLTFGATALSGAEAVETNGEWDHVLHLIITDEDGVVYRRKCRSFFEDSGEYCVSIDRPWIDLTQENMTFRLYQPYFSLRDDVTHIESITQFNQTGTTVVKLPAISGRNPLSEGPASAIAFGNILTARRGPKFQVPAPNKAPVAALYDATTPPPITAYIKQWLTTKEPPGVFSYCYTYALGRRPEDRTSPGGRMDPVWESAPSPVSNDVEVTFSGSLAPAVKVTGHTNIDWQQDFDPATPNIRTGHSGWRKIFYRLRSSVNAGSSTVQEVESPDIYFRIGEELGNSVLFDDDGDAIPEYERRRPESHGYWLYEVDPPGEDIELDFRVTRRPLSLLSDYDTPQINPEFEDVLITLVAHYAAKMDDALDEATALEASYLAKVSGFRAKEANDVDYVPGLPWIPTPGLPTEFLGRYIP